MHEKCPLTTNQLATSVSRCLKIVFSLKASLEFGTARCFRLGVVHITVRRVAFKNGHFVLGVFTIWDCAMLLPRYGPYYLAKCCFPNLSFRLRSPYKLGLRYASVSVWSILSCEVLLSNMVISCEESLHFGVALCFRLTIGMPPLHFSRLRSLARNLARDSRNLARNLARDSRNLARNLVRWVSRFRFTVFGFQIPGQIPA
jgi:hypothetical protein